MFNKKICFVIPCKNSEYTNQMALNCIQSVRKVYPGQDIHIVDSNSDLRDPLREMSKEENVFYHEIDNTGYSTGALWSVFDEYGEEYDNYFLIHDSTEMVHKIENIEEMTIAPICYEEEWEWPNILDPAEGVRRTSEFVERECKKHDLDFIEDFTTILGPMFLIKSSLLNEIKKTGFYKVRPSNKYESECMERFWGMQFCKMGLEEEVVKNSIIGRIPDYFIKDTYLGVRVKRKPYRSEDKVVKYWVKRK